MLYFFHTRMAHTAHEIAKGSSMFILAYLHIHNGTSHIPLPHYLSLLHYLHYVFIRSPWFSAPRTR